jgi:hypothetical protein
MKFIKHHKISSTIVAVLVLAAIIVSKVVSAVSSHTGSAGAKGGTAVPGYVCSDVKNYLSNAQSYIYSDDGQDLWNAADNAENDVQGSTDFSNLAGTPIDTHLEALEI